MIRKLPAIDRTTQVRILAGGFLTAMLAALWWPKPPLPFGTSPQRWKDALHAPFFAILTLVIFALIPDRWKISRRILAAVGMALVLSPLTEALQPLFNRNASFKDLFANTAGILAAAGGLWIFLGRTSGPRLKSAYLLAMPALMLVFFSPVIGEIRARKWLAASLPELSSFEDRRSQFFWDSQGQAALTFGEEGLKIETRPGNWSGVSFFPGTQDWSDRRSLVLELENPGPAFAIGVRVDDDGDCTRHESRFNGGADLATGTSVHRFSLEKVAGAPAERRLNLSAVTRLALYVGPDDPPRIFFLKRAFLE